MAQATRVQHGDSIDYTPAAAVTGGDVVVQNGTIGIAEVDIAANELGALAIEGVFAFAKGATAFSYGDDVFWDDTNNVATPTNTGPRIGKCVKAAVSGDSTVNASLEYQGKPRVGTSTVAATGSAQGDAATLQEGFNLVTAADATKGVILPAAAAGLTVQVKNAAAAVLKVYPATGDVINALSANAAMSIAAQTNPTFTCYDGTTWFTNPLLPA